MVCFAELIEQRWGFMHEVLQLVTVAGACCAAVLDAWATKCRVIVFQGVCQKTQAGFAEGWLKQE